MSLTAPEFQVRLDRLVKTSHAPRFYDLTFRPLNAAWSCSQLHDLGNLSIPDFILDKTGPLTAEEARRREYHAEYGKLVLDALFPLAPSCPPLIRHAREICLHRHERCSGASSPDPLCGDEIPCYVQLVSLTAFFELLIDDITSELYQGGACHA